MRVRGRLLGPGAGLPRTLAALAALAAGCSRGPVEGGGLFTEITGVAGIAGGEAWPDGRYDLPEITSAGIALFDADGDEDLDILHVRHSPPGQPVLPAPDRLYLQESPGRFVEATGAGLDDPGYGNGAAVGDADGDGDLDVYVANVGRDTFYLNAGGGKFTDATERSGIRDEEWSSAAAFLDHDRDGDLDLYVVHYVALDPTRICRPRADAPREYCGPGRYQSVPDRLYKNRGDGTFEDVSTSAGIVQARAGLGVVCADLTGDGWVDIYVANDRQPNLLHVNRRDGTFADEALERGLALSGSGDAEASMGIALGDVNGDSALDLLVTNLAGETATLYLGSSRGVFEDRSSAAGLGAATLRSTGWGCGFADLDNDGDLDLPVVNGRVERGSVHPGARLGAFWNDYAEPNQLFINEAGRFTDASGLGGAFTSEIDLGRALAFGDLDGDGDIDLATSSLSDRLRIYRNDAPPGRHWLRVRALIGKRDALGAVVSVDAGGVRRSQHVLSAYSYGAASEAVAHFGLGAAATVSLLEVSWPDGTLETFPVPVVDRRVTVRRGEGAAVAR